jgi:hypothetical protein
VPRPLSVAAVLALPALLVTACVGAAPVDPLLAAPPPAPGGGGSSPLDEAVVGETFRRYTALLLERDFAGTCALNAPETTGALLEDVRSRGLPANTCEEAMTAVYAAPGAARVADGIARTTEVQRVAVTGETASVTWSGESAGQRRTVTTGMRRIDGRWTVVDAQ